MSLKSLQGTGIQIRFKFNSGYKMLRKEVKTTLMTKMNV